MATIYTDKTGRQVYDYNGVTVDAKTGQPVGPVASATPAPAPSVIPSAQPAQSGMPTANLQPGMTGPAVKQLQDFLVAQGLMTQAQVNTGYGTYGPQTTRAVQALQQQLGVDNSSGPGYYGPKTISAVQGALSAPQNGGGGDAGGAITYTSTGDKQLDAILDGIKGLGNSIIQSGYTIPKTLEITPELVGQFLDFAHKNVDPYYKQLLDARIVDVNANLKNLGTQFDLTRDQTVQQFGTDLATEQNTSGANGTAFSGLRTRNENNMANTTNRNLASLGSTTALNVGTALRAGASDVGAANAGAFQLPTLAGGQVGITGGSRGNFTSGNTLDFGYNPSIYSVGNIPSAQGEAAKKLQQTYLGQYGTLAGAQSNSGRSVGDLFNLMGLK